MMQDGPKTHEREKTRILGAIGKKITRALHKRWIADQLYRKTKKELRTLVSLVRKGVSLRSVRRLEAEPSLWYSRGDLCDR